MESQETRVTEEDEDDENDEEGDDDDDEEEGDDDDQDEANEPEERSEKKQSSTRSRVLFTPTQTVRSCHVFVVRVKLKMCFRKMNLNQNQRYPLCGSTRC